MAFESHSLAAIRFHQVHKMKVITSPEIYLPEKEEVAAFLAGGITNCREWQSEVLEHLKEYDRNEYSLDKLVIYNPRRENFPIDDPSASYQQIKWEFDALQKMDIFSMFFAEGPSQQPICLYELGRNLVMMQNRFPISFLNRIIVACSPDYSRSSDVYIQTQLALNGIDIVSRDIDTKKHAMNIINSYLKVLMLNTKETIK